jgi:hypothetical protein
MSVLIISLKKGLRLEEEVEEGKEAKEKIGNGVRKQ